MAATQGILPELRRGYSEVNQQYQCVLHIFDSHHPLLSILIETQLYSTERKTKRPNNRQEHGAWRMENGCWIPKVPRSLLRNT